MNIQIEQYSYIGDKEVNEDYQDFYLVNNNFLALVADGMGSHGKGDVASRTAVDSIKKFISNNIEDISEISIQKALDKANMDVISKQIKSSEMKATICLVAYIKNNLYFAHLGDSRIYFFANNEISYLSRDHSVARLQYDIGEINFDQIRGHIDRNRVTKALGASDDEVKPIIKKMENLSFSQGDAILLCTDGFWEEILEEQMLFELSKTKSAKDWLKNMVNIVENTNKQDKDNITATVIRFFN